MNIESNAGSEIKRGSEIKMVDIQKVLVADHIQRLERDVTPQAGRRRAPRAFAHEARVDGHGLGATSVRFRLGRWVVAVGQAIAGPAAAADDAPNSMPNAA